MCKKISTWVNLPMSRKEYISKGIIAEIVKGPKNRTSDNDLAAIFGKMERTDIPIRPSKASYR